MNLFVLAVQVDSHCALTLSFSFDFSFVRFRCVFFLSIQDNSISIRFRSGFLGFGFNKAATGCAYKSIGARALLLYIWQKAGDQALESGGHRGD